MTENGYRKTEFAEITEIVRNAVARLEAAGEPAPTVFETETAMAFLYFRKKKCDLAVVEAGLGGALDATNIIHNTVCAAFATHQPGSFGSDRKSVWKRLRRIKPEL